MTARRDPPNARPYLLPQLAAALGLFCANAQASNFHEHYQYLPSFEDFDSTMSLAEIPLDRTSAAQAALDIFGEDLLRRAYALPPSGDPKALKSALERSWKSKGIRTLGALAEDLGQAGGLSPGEITRSFFQLTSLNRAEGSARLAKTYTAIGNFRNAILSRGSPWRNAALFRAYARRVPVSDRLVLSLSVPVDMAFSGKNFRHDPSVLRQVQQVLASEGSRAEFFLSIPRSRLFDPRQNIAALLAPFQDEKNIFHGIDVTGSLFEHRVPDYTDPAFRMTLTNRLLEVMEALRSTGRELRLHAFERANKGDFYRALWHALAQATSRDLLPEVIRIGHIDALETQDIVGFRGYMDYLERARGQSRISRVPEFLFEVNVESNLRLSDRERAEHLRELARKIELLAQNRFKVVLGSDGQGILGEASGLSRTLKSLRVHGLSEGAAVDIVNRSFAPDRSLKVAMRPTHFDEVRRSRAFLLREQHSPGGSGGSPPDCMLRAIQALVR